MKVNDFIFEADPSELEKDKRESYGQELIMDIHDVPKDFFDTKIIRKFAEALCDEIKMKRGPIYLWGNDKSLGTMHNPKSDGISCVQFLYSSSITMHCIDELGRVFLNIFSCKKFDADVSKDFVLKHTGGKLVKIHNIIRD